MVKWCYSTVASGYESSICRIIPATLRDSFTHMGMPTILCPLPPQFEDSRPKGPRVKLLHDQQERRAARDDDLPCQATI
jgi:hypothetical protein